MKLHTLTPVFSAFIICIFFAIALYFSQRHFNKQFEKVIEPVSTIRQTLDSVGMKLDSAYKAEPILAVQKARFDIQKEQYEIVLEKHKQQLFWYNISFLGIGTFLGFLTFLFWIPKEIEKKAKLEVDQAISERVNSRVETVATVLNKYDKEALLVKDKRIYLITNERDKIIELLNSFGFNERNYVNEIDSCDVIFIYDDEKFNTLPGLKDKSKEEIEKQVQEWEEKENKPFSEWKNIKILVDNPKHLERAFFFYSNKGVFLPLEIFHDIKTKARINFATNPAQIYGNLLNTLKYQDKLQQQKQ